MPHSTLRDPFNLERFVSAQAGVYARVVSELRSGKKRTHWIWFVFPQIAGLGKSATAAFYALSGIEEAYAYLAHPVLGARLIACTTLVLEVNDRSLSEIFGYPDDLKFRSSMTLFAALKPVKTVFKDALNKYSNGEPDPMTLAKL